MKMKVTIYTALLAGIALTSSCKKDDNKNNGGGTSVPSSSDITAGQCSIAFNTDKDFNGTTTISISPSNTTFSTKNTTGNKDQLTLQAISNQISGTSAKITTAQLSIYVPTGSNGSNLSGSFNGSGDVVAHIMVSNLNAGQSTPAYASESGSITITKITATELEGSFTADCVNESENTTIKLTNGKFAAKFK